LLFQGIVCSFGNRQFQSPNEQATLQNRTCPGSESAGGGLRARRLPIELCI